MKSDVVTFIPPKHHYVSGAIPEQTDAYFPSWHEFKNSVA